MSVQGEEIFRLILFLMPVTNILEKGSLCSGVRTPPPSLKLYELAVHSLWDRQHFLRQRPQLGIPAISEIKNK